MTTKMFWTTMLVTTCLIPVAGMADGPLPTDPTIVAGDITITSPSANDLLVQQSGQYGIVDWGSFSVANGFGVNFQNGSGATLNRVTGTDLSQIYGSLTATGSLYLVNQNGILFGKDGVVNTGGSFVASTLDIADGDFLDGGDATFRGDADSYVVNLGTISSLGGDVAILARNVVNEGTVLAPNGTVGLAAGREILMRDASVDDGLFSVRIGGDDTSVTDSGTIRAAAAELRANGGNVYALAGNTEGTIAATGVAKVKGRVFLTAGDGGHVQVEKTVKATNADGHGGTIAVSGGTVDMAGRLDASGSQGGAVRITSDIATVFTGEVLAFGDGSTASGGFVEVSGRHLTFGGTVETRGGTVLIDPDNIEISASTGATLSGASLLTPDSIVALLASQDVIIQTSSSATEAGTIVVTDAIDWTSNHSLTFLAHGDVWFRASVQGNDTLGGDLNIVAGWDGVTSGTPFDANPFITADLASQTLFGNTTGVSYDLSGTTFNALGVVYIRQSAAATITAVGARTGDTRVFSASVLGGSGGNGFTQLGYNVLSVSSADPASGDILVRATDLIWLFGGTAAGSASQIGHGGMSFVATTSTSIEALGDITVEAGGNILLDGGTAANTYAMIGNGSLDVGSLQPQGSRSGNITVTSQREISIGAQLGGFSSSGWIGHATGAGTISGADITVTARNFDQDFATDVGPGGVGTLDIAMLALDSEGGQVNFISTDTTAGAELLVIGDTINLDCECNSVNTSGSIIVQSGGDLRLDTDFFFSNIGGGNIALVAGRDFNNDAGATAFGTIKGDWQVYSTRPDNNTGDIGVLPANYLLYNTAFDPADPFGTGIAGDGLIYTVAPVVTVDDATTTYGTDPVLFDARLTVNGATVDAAAFGVILDPSDVNQGLVTFSATGNINAGSYVDALQSAANADVSVASLVSGIGSDFGQLDVDQAVLTATIIGTPTKVYDATTAITLTGTDFLLSGFVLDEDGAVATLTGNFASPNASGAISLTALFGAGDITGSSATDLANYVLPTTASGTGAITPKAVSGSVIATPTKVYDGTTLATLTTANFLLSGFVGTDGATVNKGTGTYGTANASATNSVIVTLLAGDYAATGTTLLGNYALPVTLGGAGVITQATVTAAIIDTPTKVYDGTTAATLTTANFLLSGFVGADGATVGVTAGSYASANASGTNLVTAALTGTDFTGTGSTLLGNYALPTTATGNGVIGQLTLTALISGLPTKVYDGLTTATLSAGDFTLTGFLAGQGATVTQTAGTYASANASGTNAVTASLTAGDFVATGATLLANYVLPTTATGTGAVTQATLTAAIIGLPTKVYDGSTSATLTAANFLLSGFVAGQGATVTQTSGTFATSAVGAGNTVTAALAAGDFTATGATLLANYILPTTATGAGLIELAPPTAPEIPITRGINVFDTTGLGQPTAAATGLEVINAETTQRILDEIRAGSAFCKALVRQEYVIDCLSDRLQSVADGISAVGEYSEVRAALEDAAQQLHALALANASADLAQQVIRASGNRRSSRPLTAVSAAAAGSANAQAAAIIAGAELVLLRSSSGSAERSVAFSQVAQVVNSTKVLLRSS